MVYLFVTLVIYTAGEQSDSGIYHCFRLRPRAVVEILCKIFKWRVHSWLASREGAGPTRPGGGEGHMHGAQEGGR